MKNFTNYSNKPIMKYYAYDWDDNILNMPTVIHMEHLVDGIWVSEDVSTTKFAEIRSLDDWRDNENSYIEFRDFGPRGEKAFFDDCILAIKNKSYGPSWEKFLETLIKGSVFSIITARGHEPNTIKNVVEYIIYNILSDSQKNEMISNLTAFQYMFVKDFDIFKKIKPESLINTYLENCDFIGVTAPSFEENHDNKGGVANPEKMKILALKEFITKINDYGEQVNGIVSLGFSDDDIKNINKVEQYFGEISPLYNINFSVFDTSNQDIIGGIKKKI